MQGSGNLTAEKPSGDDLERIAEVIMPDMPLSMTTDALSAGCADGRTSTALSDTLASLTEMLDDVTEERPALSQLFVALLSTIPSLDSLSDSDAEAVVKMQAKAAAVTSIPQTAFREIQLLATSADGAGDPAFKNEGEAQGEQSVPTLPPSPDPWLATASGTAGDAAAPSSSKIGAPPYITFLVQHSIDTSRGPSLNGGVSSVDTAADVPAVYKRLVHTAPEVSSRPTTFIYHLLCASFGLLVSSMDDLQLRAVREEQQSTSMMDSVDEVMLNLNGGQSGEMSDNLKYAKMKEIIARDGWKTWFWCFSGLVQVVQYWKALGENCETGVFAHHWQLPVSPLHHKILFLAHSCGNQIIATRNSLRSRRTV